MTEHRSVKWMNIVVAEDGLTSLDLGDMEIWDGADLSLLRDVLTRLIEQEIRRVIRIDMRTVKYIPSGFFGMLFDWREKTGVEFQLFDPQPNVRRMLWFRQFFAPQGGPENFVLLDEPKQPMIADVPATMWPKVTGLEVYERNPQRVAPARPK